MENSMVDIEGLCRLSAKHVMSKPVQVAYEDWSVKQLMKFLSEAKISGAPVLNQNKKLIGVVSISDVVKFENSSPQDKIAKASLSCYLEFVGYQPTESDLKSMLEHADENCSVGSIMTPSVISVGPETYLPEIASIMQVNNIHRVFVKDEDSVVGVVSTSNILSVIGKLCDCSL